MFDQNAAKSEMMQAASVVDIQAQNAQQDTSASLLDHNKMDNGLSDGEDAQENKREVDAEIAQELRQQEDSYTDQIASLDIENAKFDKRRTGRDSSAAPSAGDKFNDD